MQKKIIALAIAAAISAPAFADNANVTVYGKAFLDIESVSNDKSALSRATRVQTNASRIGFKGKEDLGDGLSGWYQYEVQFDSDGNSGNGAVNGTRISVVGLEGGFGTVMLGNWDTPFKVARNKIELFDNTTVFSTYNLMGRANGGAVNFDTRQKNVTQYWSPSLGGVKVNVAYSPDEGTSAGAATTTGSNKSSVSAAATYDVEELYVSAAYETRADASVATTSDTAARLVARYKFGDFWLGGAVESITVNKTISANYSQSNVELVGEYKLGGSKVAFSYAKAGATSTANTGATQLTLRYGMTLSKRTELFAAYTSLQNETAGAYGFNGAVTFGNNAGSTQSAIGTGLIVSF
jgi:predicted porin